MKIKALNSFAGVSISMGKGEVTECNDEVVLRDLFNAGYIEEVEPKNEDPKKPELDPAAQEGQEDPDADPAAQESQEDPDADPAAQEGQEDPDADPAAQESQEDPDADPAAQENQEAAPEEKKPAARRKSTKDVKADESK